MADEEGTETNYFKIALNDAMRAIDEQRGRFVGSPSAGITRAVSTSGGWVCSEGDRWSDDCSTELSGVVTAFDDAYEAVRAVHDPMDDKVEAGHEHGEAYRGNLR